jgi:hypothetical protein
LSNTRAEEIRSCLAHILSSNEFSGKEKNCLLLKFLVEETLAGRADQLKQYTIGTSILNRPPDFNPDLDPIVRILAGRLRRSLKTYYEQALTEAAQYDLSILFWTPLLRSACLGQLQRKTEAAEEINHLLKLKPDFTQKARLLIQHFIKEDSLVNHVMEGLQKAGLKI